MFFLIKKYAFSLASRIKISYTLEIRICTLPIKFFQKVKSRQVGKWFGIQMALNTRHFTMKTKYITVHKRSILKKNIFEKRLRFFF